MELRAIVASLILARRLENAGMRPKSVRAQLKTISAMAQKLHRRIEGLAAAEPDGAAAFAHDALSIGEDTAALAELRDELIRFEQRARVAHDALPPESWGHNPATVRRAYIRRIVAFYERRGRASAIATRMDSGLYNGPFLDFARELERLLPEFCRASSPAELTNEIKRVVRVIHSTGRKAGKAI